MARGKITPACLTRSGAAGETWSRVGGTAPGKRGWSNLRPWTASRDFQCSVKGDIPAARFMFGSRMAALGTTPPDASPIGWFHRDRCSRAMSSAPKSKNARLASVMGEAGSTTQCCRIFAKPCAANVAPLVPTAAVWMEGRYKISSFVASCCCCPRCHAWSWGPPRATSSKKTSEGFNCVCFDIPRRHSAGDRVHCARVDTVFRVDQFAYL